jgi:predicted nucleic acid-binding protein
LIFVDSSFWIGFLIPRDSRHRDALEVYERTERHTLVTTNHVRGETWTFVRRRAGHDGALRALAALAPSPRLRIDHVSHTLEDEALEWLRRHDEREYSFVDATSFAVMRRLRIWEALAFDGDFAAAGFVELRA